MSSKNKFFFEEDESAAADGVDTGVSYEEQADIFGSVVQETVGSDILIGSMAPISATPDTYDMHTIQDALLRLEYGQVGDDIVLHITPVHPQRNLRDPIKLRKAIEETILTMNTIVPFDVMVRIVPPRDDWEVKMTSFIIEKGAIAWNLDKAALYACMPDIHTKIKNVCVTL